MKTTVKHWTAFGSLFFLLHQGKLLWLLNAPVVGRWFRRVMRVSGESSSVGRRRIFRILPHAIFWWDGPNQKAEFRTHAKFSKRLYYAFAPLWWMLHAWDWLVADRWIPQLSFGFSTLTSYPDADPETDTVDGWIDNWYSGGTTWATLHDATAGTNASSVDAGEAFAYCRAFSNPDTYKGIGRSIFLFNTSALTAAANISAAVMSLYGTAKEDGYSTSPTLDIYTSNPASDTALAVEDYDQVGTISQTGGPMAYASFSITGYNAFTFDATGRNNISKTGISKFGARNANHDAANSAPAWASLARYIFSGYYADQAGTDNDPKLVVTYTITAGGFLNRNYWWNQAYGHVGR